MSQDLTEYFEAERKIEAVYLASDDPIRQSGFGAGPARWRAEREPILNAVNESGDMLDVGCANGYLLACLMEWGGERNLELIPYGVDLGPGLIGLARRRHTSFSDHFHVANAWDWRPPRRFRYVYAIKDCVPDAYVPEFAQRLLDRCVAPGGRLIIGAYGSVSRKIAPLEIGALLESAGFKVAGMSQGGAGPVTRFAWIDSSSLT